MRHIRFLILESLMKDYEAGKYNDLRFLELVISALQKP